jgi:hypothetical protein
LVCVTGRGSTRSARRARPDYRDRGPRRHRTVVHVHDHDGEWNEDYTEFRIKVDLDRGDVGPVTYGANPYTLIASRAGEFLSAIPDMPVLAAREAMSRLAQRGDIVAEKPAACL